MEETQQVEGFDFRPFFTAATSLDGSLSSTYQDGVQAVVCDNTLSAALGERTNRVKIKHSRKSLGRIGEVRDALGIVLQTSKAFEQQVRTLIATEVTDKAWAAFLDAHVELPEKPGRGRTLAETKREQLSALYRHDDRVAPWAGTAFGVLQAVNTFTHHVGTVRGATRQQRNAERAVLGGIDALDLATVETLQRVLASA
jgi:phage/plasmid-like protein (TIGR03299 family)